MQSNNPVFNRTEGFNGRAAGYPGVATQQPGYADFGSPSGPGYEVTTDRMTIDSVIQKTGLSLGLVVLAAAATWILTGDVVTGDPEADRAKLGMLGMVTMVGMFAGLGISLFMMFKKKAASPALVLAYSAAEGVFLGGFSKMTELFVAEGLVVQAVLGTIFASAGVLAAYKFFNIKVGDRFRKGFVAFAMGFGALALLELALSFLGMPMGLFGNGGLGLIFAIGGLLLGVVGLIMDFDFVERGIAAGLPQPYSWTAAFGLVSSLVMVYFYLLRLLSILNSD